MFKTSDYTPNPESYREITRKDYPNWGGWKEIDRHKEMYGFPENLAFSNVLEILYKDWEKHEDKSNL
jgi:hypothetical protein